TGAELQKARAEFVASREAFRDFFVGLMAAQQLDALLYPANLARPHTHEGGLQRLGGGPGTCPESAATAPAQVAVPSPSLPGRGRYRAGTACAGRPWSDARVLSLAYAYEQATHHRVPPPTVR